MEAQEKQKILLNMMPNLEHLMNMTPEEQLKHDAEVEEWERKQDLNACNKAYFSIGASKNALERADFENFKITGTNWEEIQPQQIMKNFGEQFAMQVKSGSYCNMIMTGKAGIGKTFTALCIAKEVCYTQKDYSQYPKDWNIRGYMSVAYRTSDYLCEELKSSSAFSSKFSKYKLIDSYAALDLLIIDEIGRTNNKYEKDTLFAILDKRYQEGKCSILISNYEQEKLGKVLGDALNNRLQESCLILNEKVLVHAPNMRNAKLRGE